MEVYPPVVVKSLYNKTFHKVEGLFHEILLSSTPRPMLWDRVKSLAIKPDQIKQTESKSAAK